MRRGLHRFVLRLRHRLVFACFALGVLEVIEHFRDVRHIGVLGELTL